MADSRSTTQWTATAFRHRPLICLVVLGCFACSASGVEPSWNQWRGQSRDGTVPPQTWPESLDGLSLEYERPLSPSYSGPIVHGSMVFTTETVDQARERVTAWDLASGDQVWKTEWDGAMAVPFFAASNGSWIRSTPAVVDGYLVTLGMRDLMVCLDPNSGDERWRVDFPKQLGTPLPSFGGVCSPLIDDDAVYIQTGGCLAKLKLDSGQVIWKSLEDAGGMMSAGAFSSPVIATLAGKRQLVVQTRSELTGVDLETGNVLWNEPIEAFRGMNILTPLVMGDRVFTSAHTGRAQMFQVSRSGDKFSVDEVWRQKTRAYMSSPVIAGDQIICHLQNQRVAALGIEDGKIRWTSQPFGKYWSMIANQGRILALDNSGDLLLVDGEADRLSIIDQSKVADDAWAHLAIHNDLLLVRDLKALKVYRWK
ncbi:MAG: PQQ-binding-like beta-propeller repeat protein [Planctomycetota bacterium]